MNSTIETYIDSHKVCNELIFRDWTAFLTTLFENSGKVEAILWFDHCKISEQEKSLGGGGYTDSLQNGYMWAETQIYETNLSNKSLKEILDYIEKTRKEFHKYDLYPCFYIQ